jgi:hypothetical protein
MGRQKVAGAALIVSVMVTAGLGAAGSPARAGSLDVPSPAGAVTGSIVVFLPGPGLVPSMPGPVSVAPRGIVRIQPTFSTTAPGSAYPGILLLSPAPASGSVVVPLNLQLAGAPGVALPQLQLVIPGPNPAQNTAISMAQLLNSVLASQRAAGTGGTPSPGVAAPLLVNVFSTSSR